MSNPLRAEFGPHGQSNVPEFGKIKDGAGFCASKAMDSYHALRDGVRYPPILLTTSSNDVSPAERRRWQDWKAKPLQRLAF